MFSKKICIAVLFPLPFIGFTQQPNDSISLRKVLDEIKPIANELKIIVANKHDIKWAETQAQEVNDLCKLYLQPEWSKQEVMLPKIIEYVQNNPKWSISLQTHKYMKIP